MNGHSTALASRDAKFALIVHAPHLGRYLRIDEALATLEVIIASAVAHGHTPYHETPRSVLIPSSNLSGTEHVTRMHNIEMLRQGTFAAVHISGFTICQYIRDLVQVAHQSRTPLLVGEDIPPESPLKRYLLWYQRSAYE